MAAISTERSALQMVLQSAAKAGRGASVLRIRMRDDALEVTCGGMERSVTVGSLGSCPPEELVEVVVPVDVVSAVEKIGGDTVGIESDGSNVVIHSGQTRLVFPVTSNVVPEVPMSGATSSMRLTGSELQRLSAQVAPFASRDGSRPALVAVHLNGKSGQATATDSYRFAVLDVEWLEATANALVVPQDVLIAASAFRDGEEVALSVDDRVVRFEAGNMTMTSRQQAADAISWAERIPEWDEAAAISMSASDLKNAMDLVGLSSPDKRAHLIFEPGSGMWVVGASHGGVSKAHVDATGVIAGHQVVNVSLTESVIARCGSDEVRLIMADAGPILVRGESIDWLGGVMPMTSTDEDKTRAREALDGD